MPTEKQMALPLFQLLQSAEDITEPGDLVWDGPHDEVDGAYLRRYEIPEGHVILTIWQGKLHEVIYQTPAEDEAASADRNASLFAHYGQGHQFNEILDNGFGKTYRRSDMQCYALWSYAMDFTTIGTMEFHDVESGEAPDD
jgi:hypothetical protein